MVIRSVSLETVVGVTTKTLPKHSLPEIAFSGRSNVGKSSLINALVGRKSLARTSSTPGKTQTINYYNINDLLYFVDLPGYGYAKVKLDFKKQWGAMIERFLKRSESLRSVFLLVDGRRPPTGDDLMMYDWVVSNGFSPVVIATKTDKLKRSELAGALRAVREAYPENGDVRVLPFSAVSKKGVQEIWETIEEII